MECTVVIVTRPAFPIAGCERLFPASIRYDVPAACSLPWTRTVILSRTACIIRLEILPLLDVTRVKPTTATNQYDNKFRDTYAL